MTMDRLLSDMNSITNNATTDLVDVTPTLLCVACAPLLVIAGISYRYRLHVETSLLVGVVRTFVQLSLLGAILHPIFSWGHQHWCVVVLYVSFMAVVAATEASGRSKYFFVGLFEMVLAVVWLTIGVMGLLAFGVILRPDPLWSPQYVIPISGMLLGNCVNAVSLSINGALTNIKEGRLEMELWQSFGATPMEASARLVREAIRVGAMPGLNGMAVIGLVAIPGMMTGQILAGNPPMKAAQYQMLITILIANMTFALILGLTGLIRYLAFDPATQIIITERFVERPQRPSLWRRLSVAWSKGARLYDWLLGIDNHKKDHDPSQQVGQGNHNGESLPLNQSTGDATFYYVAPTNNGIQLTTCHQPDSTNDDTGRDKQTVLEVTNLGKCFDNGRVLFDQLSFKIHASSIVIVSGPSGSGKSQLLRLLAGLALGNNSDDGTLLLRERTLQDYTRRGKAEHWRRKVRYVGQQKMELLGTPMEFIQQLADLQSWRKSRQTALCRRQRLSRDSLRSGAWSLLRLASPAFSTSDPTKKNQLLTEEDATAYRLAEEGMPEYNELLQSTTYLIQQWGLETSALDTKWKLLSGGEAQRVHVALAIASRPRILLLDEATSALDLETKLRVENSIKKAAITYGMGVVWVTHDDEQMKRVISPE